MAKKTKGAKVARNVFPQLKTSQYTSPTVTLHFGPTQQIYYLPEVLLQKLENIPSRDAWTNVIHLVDVDASIGHVLIHFLHTDIYQTLNDEDIEDDECTHKTLVQKEFQTAVLVLEASKKYSVSGLHELAQIELERRGEGMCLREVVSAIREESIAGTSDGNAWLRNFVLKKVRWTFEQDPLMLSAPDFFENIGSPTLTQLLAQFIVGLFSEEVYKLRKGKTATDKMSTPDYVNERELEPKSEPVPEPELEPEPPKVEVDPYAGLNKSQAKKLKAKLDKEAKLKEVEVAEILRQEEETERIRLEEKEAAAAAEAHVSPFDPMTETGATSQDDDCELRSEHLSRDDGWQSCKPCELYMRKIALKFYWMG